MPGGFCDPGEHPVQTAEREILEEAGLRVVVTGFLGMWLDDYGDAKRTLNIYYHARLRGPFQPAPNPAEIVEARGMKQVTDTGAIEKAVDEIIAANPDQVAKVLAKPTLAGWFVGQVMKATGGKANPQAVQALVKAKLGIEE